MKRKDFFKFNRTKKYDLTIKLESNSLPSQVDPTQAQSGRDLLFNPKPIKYRGVYSNGVKLEDMQPFDNPNADKFDVMRAAQKATQEVKDNVKKMEQNAKDSKK